MEQNMGEIIARSRTATGLTQDEFGRRYSVSGPAVFKFEKGHAKPSLRLWLRMAADAKVPENSAILLYVKDKLLPRKLRDFIDLNVASVREEAPKYARRKDVPAADPAATRETRKKILADSATPSGLKELLKDDSIWDLYQPTVKELEALRNVFGQLGPGSKHAYREALRLLRDLSGA
jgi:transcriptional regulator with XRE-family HTH domain